MPWKTSPLRPRKPLVVVYRGVRYTGWISDIFRGVISRHEVEGIRLPAGWEDEVWEALMERYPRYVKKVVDPKDAPLSVSVSTVTSFLNFVRRRGFNKELVDYEVAEKRAAICAACPKAAEVVGCTKCKAMARQIVKTPKADFVPKEKSGCTACGCFVDVKVWIPFSQLKSSVPEHDWSESCWMLEKNGHE